MSAADIIASALIALAFIAVCVRVHRRGVCADCAQAGGCTGRCDAAHEASCPALRGIDAVADELGRDVR